ncbi:hypothetical protein [Geomicrobium sp. JCM 19037]|nr:hypothetical protein [Geomicrobium sp. JCM 19037]
MDRLRNKPLKRYTAGKISIAFIIVYIIFMGYAYSNRSQKNI